MIIIKIKTWKDYKTQFINWVKEPRQRRCKEYVNYVNQVSTSYIESLLIPKCKDLHLDEKTTEEIVETTEKCFKDSVEDAKDLIETCQPRI